MEYLKISDYKYHFGLKVRIYPNYKQKRIIRVNSNASRFIYNQLVAIDNEIYELESLMTPNNKVKYNRQRPIASKMINNMTNIHQVRQTECALGNFKPYLDRLAYLKEFKGNVAHISSVHTFLRDKYYDSLAGAYAKRSYQLAWDNFKKIAKARRPTFHSKKRNPYEEKYQTYVNPRNSNFIVDNTHLKLPKIKTITCDSLRDILQNKDDFATGTITVYKDNLDAYWVSVQLGSETPFVDTPAMSGKRLGIDLNLDNFLTDSDGNVVANPKYYRESQHRLANVNRIVSRRYLSAKRDGAELKDRKLYQKMRKKQAKISQRVRNKRKSFLDKLSTEIIMNNDVVCLEELRSSNMIKNRKLAKSIMDVGWRTFITMCEYKAKLYGKKVITVSPNLTTQTCSNCGYLLHKDEDESKNERLKLNNREWTCPSCHAFHIRDCNAAKNILTKGLNALAEEK